MRARCNRSNSGGSTITQSPLFTPSRIRLLVGVLAGTIWLTAFSQVTHAQRPPAALQQLANAPLSKSLEDRLATIEQKLSKLDSNKKDGWDILAIFSTMLIPIAVATVGGVYSYYQAKKEQEIAQIQAKVSQSQLISTFLDSLVSTDSRKRDVAVAAISLGLPAEKAQMLISTVVKSDPDKNVQTNAINYFLTISSDYQRNCLRHMNTKQKFLFQKHTPNAELHKNEIRSLFSGGLIERRPGPHGFRSLFEHGPGNQDINDHFQLTALGKEVAEQLNQG